MDRLKEVGKAKDRAGYAMGPIINENAQKGDKEEGRRATHLRQLNSMAMAREEFEP